MQGCITYLYCICVYQSLFTQAKLFHCPYIGNVPRLRNLRYPDQKMSKSGEDSGRINLTDVPDVIRKKIRRSVTDSINAVTYDPASRPGISNLVETYAALQDCTVEEVCTAFSGKQTVELKDELIDLLVTHLTPIQRKIDNLRNDITYVDNVLRDGCKKASNIAAVNYNEIEAMFGIL